MEKMRESKLGDKRSGKWKEEHSNYPSPLLHNYPTAAHASSGRSWAACGYPSDPASEVITRITGRTSAITAMFTYPHPRPKLGWQPRPSLARVADDRNGVTVHSSQICRAVMTRGGDGGEGICGEFIAVVRNYIMMRKCVMGVMTIHLLLQ